jgi:hypothetical protein
MLSTIPGATAASVLYAVDQGWRLMAKEAN